MVTSLQVGTPVLDHKINTFNFNIYRDSSIVTFYLKKLSRLFVRLKKKQGLMYKTLKLVFFILATHLHDSPRLNVSQ